MEIENQNSRIQKGFSTFRIICIVILIAISMGSTTPVYSQGTAAVDNDVNTSVPLDINCSYQTNTTFETRVVELINAERTEVGLLPLYTQSQLMTAARLHSADMACNDFFSHTGSDGSSLAVRIARQGYSGYYLGENIAAGYSTPEAVVNTWMNSAGHRANILNTNYTEIGVGYVYWAGSTYGAYWTTDFATPNTYSISGVAATHGGVVLTYLDGTTKTVQTDASGHYTIRVPSDWSGSIAPTHACYTFSPTGRTYSNVTSNQSAENYTATFEPASGCADVDVNISGQVRGSYGVASGQERREYYDVSDGPVVVESKNGVDIVSAIRLQSYASNALYSFVETMGVPSGLLSHKYYFPTYNNTWAPLNSQIRFGNLDAVATTIRVTIGGDVVWEDVVPGLEERRLYFDVSGGLVIIESLDPAKKIVAAIRLQSYANNTLYSFSETMGIPAGQMSDTYYFPTYNNTWGPLNSQLRFGNLGTGRTEVRVTIGDSLTETYIVDPQQEMRLYYDVSGGPVIVESLADDPQKGTTKQDIVAAIRLQSYANNTLYSFVETMGVPSGLLSHKYYFPTYNNTWGPLNSQIRFGNLDAVATTIRVTIGGNVEWEEEVPGLEERRLYFDVSGGPVIIESLDPAKKIVAAIRLQSYANNTLYSFSETMGIPAGQMSDTYYFPTYNNTWLPLNSQLRFGVP